MNRPRARTVVALGAAAVLVALVAAWDWNWFRDPVVDHLVGRSGRHIGIGDVSVRFEHGLDPTVRLKDVRIDNAPWVRATRGQPFAQAGEVAFTFAWRSLLQGRPVVSRLTLVDADIALERRADGQRNWRLREPDDRGPGKFRFLRLEAHRSRLRFVHEGIGLDLRATAEDRAPADGLAVRIRFEGRYADARFSGTADTAPILTFMDTGEPFRLRGDARSGASRLEVDGHVSDLLQLGGVEADVRLSGRSLGELRAWRPGAWPPSVAYAARSQIIKVADRWQFDGLHAEVGASHVAGDFSYDGQGDRPRIEATLRSDRLRLRDLWPAGAPMWKAEPEAEPALRRFDGEASLTLKALELPGLPALTQARLQARLADGRLDLSPVQAQVAGGTLQARASWVHGASKPELTAHVALRQLRLELLLPPLPADGEAAGPLSADLDVTSRGATVDALLAHASGRAHATLKGGRLSPGLDARLALDGGKLLRSRLGDGPDVPIVCGRADLTLRDGAGSVTALVLDTARTRVDGRGHVDLGARRAELLLTPRRKNTALLALDRSIRITAGTGGVDVKLVPREPIEPEAACEPAAAVKAR